MKLNQNTDIQILNLNIDNNMNNHILSPIVYLHFCECMCVFIMNNAFLI